ncbi:MAG: hypothetical protein QM820_36155 [Minicystis sp.]
MVLGVIFQRQNPLRLGHRALLRVAEARPEQLLHRARHLHLRLRGDLARRAGVVLGLLQDAELGEAEPLQVELRVEVLVEEGLPERVDAAVDLVRNRELAHGDDLVLPR